MNIPDLLHFGKASRACNLSPSALTRSIQRLEDEIGHPLFVRDNRSVSLTPAGRRFQDYARQAKQEWQALQQELQESPSVSGPLSIYASITAVYSLLPQLLENYRTAWPDVQIELRTGAAEQAVEQVLTGEMDLAVAALPDRRAPQLEFLSLTRIPLLFIAPRQGLLSEPTQKNNRLDLGRTPLVLPRSGLSRRRLDQWMKKQNIVPQIASEVSGNEALIAMVRLGCGIGIVPQLVLEKSPFRDEVQILESAPQLDPYDVGLCATRRGLARPAVLAFWNLAEQK
jgi:LysR family positive regulator for ilvC